MTYDGPHGYGAFSRSRCHCDVCTTAGREYRRDQRARRLASGNLVHGLRAAYDVGCRCGACRQARKDAYARESSR